MLHKLVTASGYEQVDVVVHGEHLCDVCPGFQKAEPAFGKARFFAGVDNDFGEDAICQGCFASAF